MGEGVGLVVAVAMSYVDWQQNPQGIFHNELGTNWGNAVKSGWVRQYLVTLPLQFIGHFGWSLGETKAHWQMFFGKLVKLVH